MRLKYPFFSVILISCSVFASSIEKPTIEELLSRPFLDDYYSNVVLGYKIVTNTPKFASRYVGNKLNCTDCHLNAGTKKNAFPLNVAGIYPKWRAKNGKRNGIALRIRECFFYNHNGIMPSNDSPEILAIESYINYLSIGETIGKSPEGRGTKGVPSTGYDPNPVNGRVVYEKHCSSCHGTKGEGSKNSPPLWGIDSYNKGSDMNDIGKAAGFVWTNMPPENPESLSHQEALDVAAFLKIQLRPSDPRKGKLLILFSKFIPNSWLRFKGDK